QPGPSLAPIVPHDLAYAGEPSEAKRARIAESLAKDRLDAAVVSAPDSIAWLLNVRGGDVEHSPLPLSFAIIRQDAGVEWFVDPRKLAPGLEAHLGSGVSVAAPGEFGPALDRLAGKRVLVDPTSA